MQQYLCHSRNECEIRYDPIGSHAAAHLAGAPTLRGAVVAALRETDVSGEKMNFEHDFGTPIGSTDLVETAVSDEIVYAKRKNRETFARFTKSRTGKECSVVAIKLARQDDGSYELRSAWIGRIVPPFPDDNASSDSREFWGKHALVWGREEIQEGTETSLCPW
jgi:hypothetical protein